MVAKCMYIVAGYDRCLDALQSTRAHRYFKEKFRWHYHTGSLQP